MGDAMDTSTNNLDVVDLDAIEAKHKEHLDGVFHSLKRVRAVLEQAKAVKMAEGNAKPSKSQLIGEASDAFVSFKLHNRHLSSAVENGRQTAMGGKLAVEQSHLALQAVKYQIHHHNTMIARCKDFQWSVGSVELVSEQEFEANAPQDLKVSSDCENREQELMVNRLQYELRLRKRLVSEQQILMNRRKALTDMVNKRQETLHTLGKQTAVLQATLDSGITNIVGMPSQQQPTTTTTTTTTNPNAVSNSNSNATPNPDSNQQQQQTTTTAITSGQHNNNNLLNLLGKSVLLPPALYCIFHHFSGFKHSREDDSLEVSIEGDTDKCALETAKHPLSPHSLSRKGDDSEDDRNGDESGDDEPAAKRLRTSESSPKENIEPHPLRIHVTIKAEDRSVTISFQFFPVSSLSVSGIVGGGVIGVSTVDPAQQSLLHDLYGRDPLKTTVPQNLRNQYPYAWAQVLGGLVHVPWQKPNQPHPPVFILDFLRRIRLRVGAASALQSQLLAFEKRKIPAEGSAFPIPGDVRFDSFEQLDSSTVFTPTEGSKFFRVRMTSENTELCAEIHLSPEYPTVAPEFSLRFSKLDPKHCINHIHAMERELNALYGEYTPKTESLRTLSFQLLKMQSMLGVYVLTEVLPPRPGSVSVRPTVGKDRQKPLVFNRETNLFEERR